MLNAVPSVLGFVVPVHTNGFGTKPPAKGGNWATVTDRVNPFPPAGPMGTTGQNHAFRMVTMDMNFVKKWLMSNLVSIVCVFTVLAVMPVRAATTTINTAATYQTIEGFGGATCFWVGNLTGHPYKMEIYTNIFAGLNLSMLRLGDWYRYQSSISSFDSAAFDVVASANRVLGHPVQVYMSSWAPPAFLKSNGQVANGGTLITTNGGFAYAGFAQYWYDSIQAYRSNGVSPQWISIQNEPDWVAGYDSCIFHPTEDTVNGTNYASYSRALDAVYAKLTNMPSPPKILAPEVVHIAYNDLANYAATLHSASFYGINYHLYGGNNSDLSSSTNIFPDQAAFHDGIWSGRPDWRRHVDSELPHARKNIGL